MFFTIFSEGNFLCTKTDMEEQKNGLLPEFEGSAAPPSERVMVTLDLDADLLEWLKAQPTDWQREINNLARFFMETSQIREAQYAPDAWEPGEMQQPPTAAP
jgi:uncharacterized protein (DUF4415 family)